MGDSMEVEPGSTPIPVVTWMRTCICVAVMLTAAICSGTTALLWNGQGSSRLTFNECVGELHGVNPQAAAERLRVKVQWAVRELRETAKRPGRDGRVAANALAHILKELTK